MAPKLRSDSIYKIRLSREIADAADELANRIELGEFDDLDEEQMAELRALSALMIQWAEHAQAIEKRAGHAAFCN